MPNTNPESVKSVAKTISVLIVGGIIALAIIEIVAGTQLLINRFVYHQGSGMEALNSLSLGIFLILGLYSLSILVDLIKKLTQVITNQTKFLEAKVPPTSNSQSSTFPFPFPFSNMGAPNSSTSFSIHTANISEEDLKDIQSDPQKFLNIFFKQQEQVKKQLSELSDKELNSELDKAIKSEQYEKAAQIKAEQERRKTPKA